MSSQLFRRRVGVLRIWAKLLGCDKVAAGMRVIHVTYRKYATVVGTHNHACLSLSKNRGPTRSPTPKGTIKSTLFSVPWFYASPIAPHHHHRPHRHCYLPR